MATFFVNCDWGTTHLRLRAIQIESLAIASEFQSNDGIARVASDQGKSKSADERFKAVLQDGLRELSGNSPAPLAGAVVIISGMASSSIGWQELPYANLPLALDGQGFVWRELDPVNAGDSGHAVILVSGARTSTDVMRGEETQILGLFQLPALQQATRSGNLPILVIMPGTHSKHVLVSTGQIQDFRTFMTGELFDVLGTHSILSHSIARDGERESGRATADMSAFRAGVQSGAGVPLSAALFRVRTRQLLDGELPSSNRAYLSGVLIGGELSSLCEAQRSIGHLFVCAPAPLGGYYANAIDALGLKLRLTVVSGPELDRLSALGQAVLLRQLGRL